MKRLFTFLFFLVITQLFFAQQKNEIGFVIAPLRQAAFEYSAPNAEKDFPAKPSLSLETGLFYTRKLNEKLALQTNINFGIVYISNISRLPPNFAYRNDDEDNYWFAVMPKMEYNVLPKSNKLQVIAGLGARYFLETESNGYAGQVFNSITPITLFFRNQNMGTYDNPISKKTRWHFMGEIGINYNANLYKNKMYLKINPFYQPAFKDAYTGVYKYTNGTNVENGTYKGRLNQSGLRILFAYKF